MDSCKPFTFQIRNVPLQYETRIHSSRMRTAHSSSCRGEGGFASVHAGIQPLGLALTPPSVGLDTPWCGSGPQVWAWIPRCGPDPPGVSLDTPSQTPQYTPGSGPPGQTSQPPPLGVGLDTPRQTPQHPPGCGPRQYPSCEPNS